MHRGPYRWSDTRTHIVCEKFSEMLNGWVPFAAQIVGSDDYEPDRLLAEDIYNRLHRGTITVEEPETKSVADLREEWIIAPIQFRRALREWAPGENGTWRDAFDVVTLTNESLDELEYGLTIARASAAFEELRVAFGWTDVQADMFFQYALTR